jgi:hypothetical protein
MGKPQRMRDCQKNRQVQTVSRNIDKKLSDVPQLAIKLMKGEL